MLFACLAAVVLLLLMLKMTVAIEMHHILTALPLYSHTTRVDDNDESNNRPSRQND